MRLLMQREYLRLGLIAFMSRALTLLFAKYCSQHYIPYDKSSAMYPTRSFFGFLNSWDSIHFLSIADNGYTYEHALPFFPLLPYISRALNFCDHLTTGIILNNIAFIVSALVLYKTSQMIFSKHISAIATLLFIFNPASIIFSSFYSESLFTLIFLLGQFYVMRGKAFKASILFGLAGLCRSNAVLFVVFVRSIYMPIVLLPELLFQCYSLLAIWRSSCSFRIFIPYSYLQKVYWDQGFLNFISTNNIPNMLIGLPIILYCIYALKKFVKSHIRLFQFEGERRSVHFNDQRHSGIVESHKSNIHFISEFYTNHFTKIYQSGIEHPYTVNLNDISGYIRHVLSSLTSGSTLTKLILDPFLCELYSPVAKLAIILAFQTFMLIFVIHWNMAMRFVSFNPLIYWMSALATQACSHTRRYKIVAGFFFTYGILYIVTFSCFYPPA